MSYPLQLSFTIAVRLVKLCRGGRGNPPGPRSKTTKKKKKPGLDRVEGCAGKGAQMIMFGQESTFVQFV